MEDPQCNGGGGVVTSIYYPKPIEVVGRITRVYKDDDFWHVLIGDADVVDLLKSYNGCTVSGFLYIGPRPKKPSNVLAVEVAALYGQVRAEYKVDKYNEGNGYWDHVPRTNIVIGERDIEPKLCGHENKFATLFLRPMDLNFLK